MAIRNRGDWESWIEFFLQGVAETADDATMVATHIVTMREEHRVRIQQQNYPPNVQRLLDVLFQRPLVNARLVSTLLDVTEVTATNTINSLVAEGLLVEITGRPRGRVYRYEPYWSLFVEDCVDSDSGQTG